MSGFGLMWRSAKRLFDGSATELEPAVKQEKLDSGYDRALLNQTGTLLGSIVPSSSGHIPYPVPVSVWSSTVPSSMSNNHARRRGRPRMVNISSVNSGHGRMIHNRPVVLLPRGGSGPLHFIAPRHPTAVPNIVQLPTARRAMMSTSSAPLAVVVSQPLSTSAARMVHSSQTSSVPLFPSGSVVCLPLRRRSADSSAMAKLKSIIGKSVLDKYVGQSEPPPELFMPKRSRHVCQGCGDEFATKPGLMDHMSRRSMLLTFHCSCRLEKWPRTFCNPCMYECFYRSHYVRPGVHVPRDLVVISALDLDTPEYRMCLEARNRETSAAGSEDLASSETTNSQSPVTMSGDPNSDCQRVSAEAQVEEEYVDVEGVENEGERKQPGTCEPAATDGRAVVVMNGVSKRGCAADTGRKGDKRKPSQNKLKVSDLLRVKSEEFSRALSYDRTKCPECEADCEKRCLLAAHFSGNGDAKQSMRCTKCELMLPTSCSFRAHLRLHENRPPFVCPQCGIIFDKPASLDRAKALAVFKAHLHRHCFHLIPSSSSYLSNCPRCNFVFTDNDLSKMADHFATAHATVYYKCRSCPKAFSNETVAARHSESTGHEPQKDILRKCPSCDTVFKGSSEVQMQTHVLEHLTTPGSPVFHCPVCAMPADDRAVVVDHMRSFHCDEILPASTCEVCGKAHANHEDLFKHVSANHINYLESVMNCLPLAVNSRSSSDKQLDTDKNMPPSTAAATSPSVDAADQSPTSKTPPSTSSIEVLECASCQVKFSCRAAYKRHQAKHKFLVSKKAKSKREAAETTDPSQQVPSPKQRSCTRCSQTFDNVSSLDRHVRTVHGSPDWHMCYLCADGFATTNQLKRHIQTRHCGKTESTHAYVCALCEDGAAGFAVQGLLTKHLQSVHSVPRKAAANMARAAAPPVVDAGESPQNSRDQVLASPASNIEPVKRLFVSGELVHYRCSRCPFSAEDRAVFVAHAAEHSPAVSGAVQCKECAASFTVAPALYRHLRIVHRLNCDIDAYIRENGMASRCSSSSETVTADERSPSEMSSGSSLVSSGGSKDSTSKVMTPTKPGNDDDDDGPGECTVCYRVFLSKPLLRSHMRVHGMAFIQRTRRKLASATV